MFGTADDDDEEEESGGGDDDGGQGGEEIKRSVLEKVGWVPSLSCW